MSEIASPPSIATEATNNTSIQNLIDILLANIIDSKDAIENIEENLSYLKEKISEADEIVEQLKKAPEIATPPVGEETDEEEIVDENESTEEDEPDEPSAGDEEEEENIKPDDNETSTPPPGTTTPTTFTIKYAPAVEPVGGTFNVACINLDWKNNSGTPMTKIRGSSRKVAQIYKELSNGALKLNMSPMNIKVNYDHKQANLRKAEKAAKAAANAKRTDGKKFDLFVIVHTKVRNYSNGGGDTAHLYGALIRDWLHELGHCKILKLGHAGKYVNGKLEAYGDGLSFMSRYSSYTLNAPQMYFLGWLGDKKVALHEVNDPLCEYNMELVSAKGNNDNLKGVLIPNSSNDGRDLFLSSVLLDNKKLFALHYFKNGGSQRVTVFGSHTEFNGMSFDKVSDQNNYTTVRISPKPQK